MTKEATTEEAFRRAGFATGRPKLRDGETAGKARSRYPEDRQAMIDLFSDDLVDGIYAEHGSNVYLMAAALVDVLITSGRTATGRPLDVSGVENGGLVTTFISGPEGGMELERRAANLRRQSLLNTSQS